MKLIRSIVASCVYVGACHGTFAGLQSEKEVVPNRGYVDEKGQDIASTRAFWKNKDPKRATEYTHILVDKANSKSYSVPAREALAFINSHPLNVIQT